MQCGNMFLTHKHFSFRHNYTTG